MPLVIIRIGTAVARWRIFGEDLRSRFLRDRLQAWITKLRTPGHKAVDLGFYAEPPIGIEPMTYSLRGHCLGRWWSLIVV